MLALSAFQSTFVFCATARSKVACTDLSSTRATITVSSAAFAATCSSTSSVCPSSAEAGLALFTPLTIARSASAADLLLVVVRSSEPALVACREHDTLAASLHRCVLACGVRARGVRARACGQVVARMRRTGWDKMAASGDWPGVALKRRLRPFRIFHHDQVVRNFFTLPAQTPKLVPSPPGPFELQACGDPPLVRFQFPGLPPRTRCSPLD